MIKLLGLGLVAAMAFGFFGCVHRSGGAWMIKSAPLPEGWPDLTPVGEVAVREYPVYRAATVEDAAIEGDGMNSMFMTLFNHIKRNDIAMTTPVEMEYTPGQSPQMATMAFLYRSTDLGETGADGSVRIEDLPAMTFASVGVRGAYNSKNYEDGLVILNERLSATSHWRAVGPPRFLGYNSPFVPVFMRYGEVQVPVEWVGE